MKTLCLAAAAFLAATAAAHAEPFSFTGTGQVTNEVQAVGPQGRPVGASFATTESQTRWASGKKSSSKGTCANWTVPPSGGITSNGACVLTDSDGGMFSLSFACAAADAKNTMANCWGGMTGTSGAYQGKTGTISWRIKVGADGKSSMSAGSGQWY
jgi:hypothetical protein